MGKTYMGLDQYGNTYHDLGPHPRKALMERHDRKHAAKMYCDKKDGSTVHTGYIVAGCWVTLYQVEPFEGQA